MINTKRLPAEALFSGESKNDPGLVQVVRRHLEFHAVAQREPDETLPHLAGNMSQYLVLVCQLHAEHRAREHGFDFAFGLNRIVNSHKVKNVRGKKRRPALVILEDLETKHPLPRGSANA